VRGAAEIALSEQSMCNVARFCPKHALSCGRLGLSVSGADRVWTRKDRPPPVESRGSPQGNARTVQPISRFDGWAVGPAEIPIGGTDRGGEDGDHPARVILCNCGAERGRLNQPVRFEGAFQLGGAVPDEIRVALRVVALGQREYQNTSVGKRLEIAAVPQDDQLRKRPRRHEESLEQD
jgi:hypothetical protein